MQNDWPYRWDLLLRYRLIEIIALWEGRLTTNHLTESFGIGRQQASKDINTYISDIAPGNLMYDKTLKGYVPSESFKPCVTTGLADEYLHVLSRNQDITKPFEGLGLANANTEVLGVPHRAVDPIILRSIVLAARQGKRLDIGYLSLSNPKSADRIIAPHTLVFTGLRWHVRAYCEKNQNFRDFVLSRFRGTPDLMGKTLVEPSEDKAWQTQVTIQIIPDTRLTPDQRKVIAHDYGMKNNSLKITTRGSLVMYVLQTLNIDSNKLEMNPLAQQLMIKNQSEIMKWLNW